MAALLRRLVLVFVAMFVVAAFVHAGAPQAQTPPTPAQTTPTPAPTPAAPPPEAAAITAAGGIREPEARIAALEKIRADFPQSRSLAQVDALLVSALLTFPDRTDAIATVVDRQLAAIPATATPEARFSQVMLVVTPLIPKKVLLDRSEKLITDAMAPLDFEKFYTTQKTAAESANRAVPSKTATESQFNNLYRARGLDALGRIYLAQGHDDRGIAALKDAIKAAPTSPAVSTLVTYYTDKNDCESAEPVLKDAMKAAASPLETQRFTMMLVDVYTKKGDPVAAESALRELLKNSPTYIPATVALAKVEEKKGNNTAALDLFMKAAIGGSLRAPDYGAMAALYSKVNGSANGLETKLDEMYKTVYPNPVKESGWSKTEARSDRLVLLEMFTGSACGPCVAADLAFDALLERYPADVIVPLAFHQHIPGPDPMVPATGNDRRLYYKISGVPTFEIDGEMVRGAASANNPNPGTMGGGGREAAQARYDAYTKLIDKQLETPAGAAVSVSASGSGDSINVTATVGKLAADAKDLRLHIVLAERELSFSGENGIRFHPTVVRAIAGEKATGLPVSGNGTFTYTFSLNAIKDDLVKSLAADIEKRRTTSPTGQYNAEGRAMTDLNTDELYVVAYVQAPNQTVLQAAKSAVVFKK